MQIVVALKEVAQVDETFKVHNDMIPESYLDFQMNEWDEYALETAVQLVEDDIAEEVVTVTVAPERSESIIREGIAKGSDHAIRIWDEALERRKFLDVSLKTEILARIVEQLSADLVLTGVQSGDEMFGATGVYLAKRLGYGWAAVVNQLDVGDGTLAVHRELEGGSEEHTEVDLPAVCTVQTGINEPRYASLRGIRMAQSSDIEILDLADLGMTADYLETRITLTDMKMPTVESAAEIWEGSANETGNRLASLLAERGSGR